MVTLQDIANKLGISRATVSRALNDFPEVSSKTKHLVREAAEELGYKPDLTARMLVTGKSGLVAMIIQEDDGALIDLSKGSFLGTLNELLYKEGLDLVVRIATEQDRNNQYKKFASRDFVDCIVINAPYADDKRIELLQANKAKFVVHGRDLQHRNYAYYDVDNYDAAQQACNYLLDLGHQRFAFLVNNTKLSYTRSRLEGFQDAIKERFGDHSSCLVLQDSDTTHFAYTVMKEALSSKERPTAVYCANDVLQAIGVYRAARELGLKIGKDLSVIAYDDDVLRWQATEFDPPLTVTKKPVNDACAYLVKAILGVINEQSIKELQFVEPVDLVVRKSTGAVPKD